jgi:glucoamylase
MTNTAAHQPLPPGHPGIPPRWTAGAKTAIGRSADQHSRIWFTIARGIVSEVYYPMTDQPNTRDLGFLVADGREFFSEEQRHTIQQIAPLAPGVPGYRLINTCQRGHYRIVKTVVIDPCWDALVQQVQFEALQGDLTSYGLYALLAPHIANRGYGNSGRADEYKGIPMLFAERAGMALALACSVPFRAMSCGYVGVSDGWQDISRHKRMIWRYPHAPDGNIALTGQIDLPACGGRFTLALAFGRNPAEAGQRARATLLHDADAIVRSYVEGWQAEQAQCLDLGSAAVDGPDLYRTSVAVVKAHAATRFPGGIIASLSIPWGASKGDDLGGYHLVWPRDLVEAAGGPAGGRRCGRCTRGALLPDLHPGGRWALAAEHVDRRHALLVGRPDGRDRFADPAGRRATAGAGIG